METEHTVSVVASAATRDNTTTLLNCESYITHPPENIAEEETARSKHISTHQYMSAKWPSAGTTHDIHSND
jgi:hypothetical protein